MSLALELFLHLRLYSGDHSGCSWKWFVICALCRCIVDALQPRVNRDLVLVLDDVAMTHWKLWKLLLALVAVVVFINRACSYEREFANEAFQNSRTLYKLHRASSFRLYILGSWGDRTRLQRASIMVFFQKRNRLPQQKSTTFEI